MVDECVSRDVERKAGVAMGRGICTIRPRGNRVQDKGGVCVQYAERQRGLPGTGWRLLVGVAHWGNEVSELRGEHHRCVLSNDTRHVGYCKWHVK